MIYPEDYCTQDYDGYRPDTFVEVIAAETMGH